MNIYSDEKAELLVAKNGKFHASNCLKKTLAYVVLGTHPCMRDDSTLQKEQNIGHFKISNEIEFHDMGKVSLA